MSILVIMILAIIVFDILAMEWGVDSRDDINSSEWERRQHWYGFH